jgi:hypothetical protein
MMPTRTLLLLVGLGFAATLTTQAQTLHRINADGTGDFTNITTALADVSVTAGDTLIVEHAASTYDVTGVTVNKAVKIFGTGYFIPDNDCTQANQQVSKTGPITITADNAIIGGLQTSKVFVNANYVRVMRNNIKQYLGLGNTGNVTSVMVQQNFIEGSTDSVLVSVVNCSNFVITNNFIQNLSVSGTAINTRVLTGNGLILNNSFHGQPNCEFHNATVQNNIFENSEFYASASGGVDASTAVSVSNNLSYGTFLNSDWGQALSSTNWPDTGYCYILIGVTRDGRYQLSSTWNSNPATNGGADGRDIGPFGGSYPYVLSGMPPLPSVAQYSGSATGTQSGGTTSTVKGKSRR